MPKVVIKSVGVLSIAKMQAALGAVIGLIIGVIYGLIIMVFGAALLSSGGRGSTEAGAGSIIGGLAAMVMIPIVYAIFSFISGLIVGFIYNLVAGIAGGVEMDIENIN